MKKHFLLSLILVMLFCSARCTDMDLYNSMLISDAPSARKGVTLTWLGTAGVFISDGQSGILIDPYVSRFGMAEVFFGRPLEPKKDTIHQWFERLGKTRIRAVIVSHSHFDHSLDAPFFAREAGAPLVGSESTLNIGRGAGLRSDELQLVRPGDTIAIGNFTVTFIKSAHGPILGSVPYPGVIDKPLVPPACAKDYKLGDVFGILIKHSAGTILHHGSAGFIHAMYDGIRADVVLMGVAGGGDCSPYLNEVALTVKPKVVIPVHVDNFFKPLEDGMSILPAAGGYTKFCKTAQRYRSVFAVRTLPLGKTVALLPLN